MSAKSIPFGGVPYRENTFSATRQQTAIGILKLPVSLLRLLALLEDSGEDDYGAKGPTQLAFLTAFRIVADAIAIVGEDFASSPSVDSEGGVRVTWKRGDRTVKLVCPATRDKAVYVYHSSPNGTSLRDEDVTATFLADKLSWLINREP
jgi:hypothetical protein